MTGGGSSISSAALCNVYVSAPTWNELVINDLLLTIVLKLASPLQVTIHYNNNAPFNLKMEIGIEPNTIVLYQRNTILRSLCSTALHNTLDRIPYYLLGGYSEIVSSKHCTSIHACTNMSLLQYWMSIASNYNGNSTELFNRLNTVLTHSSYLTNTALPTTADMDVTIMIVSKLLHYDNATTGSTASNVDEEINKITIPVLLSTYPSVVRWLNQTIATIVSYATNTSNNSFSNINTTIVLPNYIQQYQTAINEAKLKSKLTTSVPIFYNGTEDITTILNPLYKTNSNSPPSSAGNNNNKKATTPALKKEIKDDTNMNSKTQQQQQPTTAESTQVQEKSKANKKEKKKAANTNTTANTTDTTPPIDNNNIPIEYTISAIDIRVGKIIKVWEHPDSDKLFCEEIDMGNGEIRTVASGIRQFYTCEQLLYQYVLVVYNLKSRNLAGFPSHGMVLCASNTDHTIVQLIVPENTTTLQLGDRIVFNGYSGDAENESKVAKKKIFEKVSPYLQTSDTGYVIWKDSTAIATTETSNIQLHAKEFLSNSKVS